jgi:cytochrome c oxidase assembly protein subunit 15
MVEPAVLDRRRSALRWLSGLGVALLLIVTTASAYIRLSNSGLGCADWPQCYGRLTAGSAATPGKAATESAFVLSARLLHRIAAVAALVLVTTLAFVCFARPMWWPEGGAALALIALTVFLTVLGRWTTGSRLPAVTLGNLVGGFAMLALLWWLRLRSENGEGGPPRTALVPWAGLALLALMLQIMLGGMIGAGSASASCPTVADCDGVWWPAPTPWQAFNPWLEPAPAALEPSSSQAAALHMAHRFGALSNLVLSGGLAVAAWSAGPRFRIAAATVLLLLLLQIALGVYSVLGGMPLAALVAHNLTAALLLLALINLGFRLQSRRIAAGLQ